MSQTSGKNKHSFPCLTQKKCKPMYPLRRDSQQPCLNIGGLLSNHLANNRKNNNGTFSFFVKV